MQITHLNALRALEAILRLGGFREASDELGVTPAAVGQQIRTLEMYLGQRLFERLPKGAQPTQLALQTSARLTASFRELGHVLSNLRPAPDTARVAVTMTLAIAENWLPQQLPDFFRSNREIDLRIDTSRAIVDLHHGDFDFAIRHMGTPDITFDSVTFFPSYIAPVCTPDFAKRYALSPETQSLAGVPLGNVDIETTDPDWLEWPDWCRWFGVTQPTEKQAQSVSVGTGNFGLATAGLALALTALVDSFDAIKRGDLVAPFGPQSIAKSAYSYRLIWPKDRRLSLVQTRFRDWIEGRATAHRIAIAHWLETAE